MAAESNVDYNVGDPEVQNDLDILGDEGTRAESDATPAGGTEEDNEEDTGAGEAGLESLEEPEPEVKTEEEPEEETEEKPKAEEKPEEEPATLHAKLKKAYPDIFKKAPELKQVIFREQSYAESFATPDDAKEAAERLEIFAPIEQGLLAGRASELLESLHNTDKELAEKVAINFLPELHKRNPEAFYKAVDPVVKNLLNAAFADARSRDDKNLENAARWLSKFIYGSFEIPQNQAQPSRPDPEREALETEKRQFAQQRFVAARDEVLSNSVGEVITNVSKTIDPEGKLTPFMKDTLTQKVMETLDGVLKNDQRHMNAMASLWRRAVKANFTPEWKARIRSAYLARARQEIPGAIAKVRKEAGMGALKAQQKPAEKPAAFSPQPAAGRPIPRKIDGPVDPKRVDWKRTSDMDILNGRITTRG